MFAEAEPLADMQTIPAYRGRTRRRHWWQWRRPTHAVCEALSSAQVRLDGESTTKETKAVAKMEKNLFFLGPGNEAIVITNHVWHGLGFEDGVLFRKKTFGGRAVALGRGILFGSGEPG